MKYCFHLLIFLILTCAAWHGANNKLAKPLDLKSVRLGMSLDDLKSLYGSPSAQNHNNYIFILDDGSELSITLRDSKISSAKVKFLKTVKIQDPKMKNLTLIQMETGNFLNEKPSWFFAGNPEEGLIYKITSDGIVESITWIPPFTHVGARPKHLQALLRDFKSQTSL